MPARRAAHERAQVENERLDTDRLAALLVDLMLIPGLSGHEGRVRRYLAKQLADLGLDDAARTGSAI